MPNGYSPNFRISRIDLLKVLQGVAGDCIVGTGLAVLPPKRLGEVSASQTILWLEGHAGELVEVEEEHHENYTAFFHSKEATSQPKEIIALVIRPSSPIYAEFRSKLEPA